MRWKVSEVRGGLEVGVRSRAVGAAISTGSCPRPQAAPHGNVSVTSGFSLTLSQWTLEDPGE